MSSFLTYRGSQHNHVVRVTKIIKKFAIYGATDLSFAEFLDKSFDVQIKEPRWS